MLQPFPTSHLTSRIKMIDPISYFRFFGIIETIQGPYQITGDPAYPFKGNIAFASSTIRAHIADDAGIAANRVAIHRMIDGTSI